MIKRAERENSRFPDLCEAQLWVGKESQSPAFSSESHQLCILLFYLCFYYDQNVVFSKKIPESQEMTWRDLEVRCCRADGNPEGSGNSGHQRTLNPWNKNDDEIWGNQSPLEGELWLGRGMGSRLGRTILHTVSLDGFISLQQKHGEWTHKHK